MSDGKLQTGHAVACRPRVGSLVAAEIPANSSLAKKYKHIVRGQALDVDNHALKSSDTQEKQR
jgi:hypothetical protein